jgi:hypothetical protein
MTTTIGGSYPAVNSDSDATINGLTVGKGAGSSAYNTVVGAGALAANTSGIINTAVGSTNGSNATLSSNTTGSGNNAFGAAALGKNTTASQNNAFGYEALRENTTGGNNVAIGGGALTANTTASNNTAVGYQALYSNTTGQYNMAFGGNALRSNTTASTNNAVGWYALYANTTGLGNQAFGNSSLSGNTTGSYNTAYGAESLLTNTTGSYNTAVGYQAGYNSAYTGNAFNTYIGSFAGYGVTTGVQNTFVGGGTATGNAAAGYYVTTGSKNTIIGLYNGNNGGLDIRTASNYIVLSDGDGNPRAYCNPNGFFKASNSNSFISQTSTYHELTSTTVSDNTVCIGNRAASGGIYNIYNYAQNVAPNNTITYFLRNDDSTGQKSTFYGNGGLANYQANDVNLSDAREKTNIELAGNYLDKICAVPVKTFNYIDQNLEEDAGLTLGVIAQEVQAVMPEMVHESNWGVKGGEERMRFSIYQTDLQYALMKAIQELKAEVDSLKQQLGK